MTSFKQLKINFAYYLAENQNFEVKIENVF